MAAQHSLLFEKAKADGNVHLKIMFIDDWKQNKIRELDGQQPK